MLHKSSFQRRPRFCRVRVPGIDVAACNFAHLRRQFRPRAISLQDRSSISSVRGRSTFRPCLRSSPIFHETGLIGTKTAADVPCLILASGLCFRFSSKTPIITLRCRRRNICLPCASAFRRFRFQFFRRRPVRGADRRNASVMRMQSIACRISSLVESRQGRLLQHDAGEIE